MRNEKTSSRYSPLLKCIYLIFAFICLIYGGLVFDIAREYATSTPPTYSTSLEYQYYVGNAWDYFFNQTAIDSNLALGMTSIGRQRPFYILNRISMISHWIGGSLLMFCGIIQCWTSEVGIQSLLSTDSFKRKLHRMSGKIYMIGAIFSLFGSLTYFAFVNWRTEIYGGYVFSIPLFSLAVISLYSTWNAWKSIKSKNFIAHVEFSYLSFTCMLTAPWLRILWIIVPYIYYSFGGSYERSTDLHFINLLCEPFVINILILITALYLTNRAELKEREIFKLSPHYVISKNKKFRIICLICIIPFLYFHFFRFYFQIFNPNFSFLSNAMNEEIAYEFERSNSMFLLLTENYAPLFYVFLSTKVVAYLTILPATSYIFRTEKSNVVTESSKLFYILFCVTFYITNILEFVLEIIQNGESFEGVIGSSIVLSKVMANLFCIIMLNFTSNITQKRWAIYCRNHVLIMPFATIIVFAVLFTIPMTLLENCLTLGMLTPSFVAFSTFISLIDRPKTHKVE